MRGSALPPGYSETTARHYPVVYFLHGLPASRLVPWRRLAHRGGRAVPGQAILVVPQGARDGDRDPEYLDWGAGRNWETAVASEVPRYVDTHYRTIRSGPAARSSASRPAATERALGLHHLAEFRVVESWTGISIRPTTGTPVCSRGHARERAAFVDGLAARGTAAADVPCVLCRAAPMPASAPKTSGSTAASRAAPVPHVFDALPRRAHNGAVAATAAAWLRLALDHPSPPNANPALTGRKPRVGGGAYNQSRDAGTCAVLGPRGARATVRLPGLGAVGLYRYVDNYWVYRGFAPPRDAAFVKVQGTATRFYVRSPALGGRRQPVDVYLPPGYARTPPAGTRSSISCTVARPAGRVSRHGPHGRGRGRARRAAPRAPLILVMPFGSTGSFTDKEWANGMRPREGWETFVARDLVRAVDRGTGQSSAQTGRAIGGLSEGGYGAINIGLHHPREFRSSRAGAATNALTRSARSSGRARASREQPAR